MSDVHTLGVVPRVAAPQPRRVSVKILARDDQLKTVFELVRDQFAADELALTVHVLP